MKATHFSWLALLGLGFGLWPAVATADDDAAESPRAAIFAKLDKNGDGTVTAEEIEEGQEKFFKRLVRIGDANDDGQLSEAEFVKATQPEAAAKSDESTSGDGEADAKKKRKGDQPARQRDPARMFKRLDQNADGKLTMDELNEQQQKRFGRWFKKLDKEELTLEDVQGLVKAAGPEAAKKNKKGEKKKGKKQPSGDEPAVAKQKEGEAKPEGGPNPERLFKRLDADGDGQVTLAEAPDQFKDRVAKMLKDAGKEEDGAINLNEFKRVAQAAARSGDRPGRGRMGRFGQGGRFGGPPTPMIFGKLDKNEDGKLSKEELTAIFVMFDELDADDDGGLDRREFFGFPDRGDREGDRPRFGRRRGPEGERPRFGNRGRRGPEGAGRGDFRRRMIDRLDKDNDGKLSKDEAPGPLKDRFDDLDKNDDGFLDADEVFLGRPRDGEGRRGRGDKEKKPGDGDEGSKDEGSKDEAKGKDA